MPNGHGEGGRQLQPVPCRVIWRMAGVRCDKSCNKANRTTWQRNHCHPDTAYCLALPTKLRLLLAVCEIACGQSDIRVSADVWYLRVNRLPCLFGSISFKRCLLL